jgi:trehalose 6-phosphate phosphatase
MSEIVTDPASAQPLPGIPDLLSVLSTRLSQVGVVSGRSLGFLQEQLSEVSNGVILAGSYGLELSSAGKMVVDPAIAPWEGKIRQAHEEVAGEGLSGIFVEDKGVGFALHWRGHPEESARAQEVAARVAAAYGLELQPGKMAIELRAPVHIDKGSTVLRLVDGRKRVCYVGDDEGDLKAYDALDTLESQYNTIVKRVAIDSQEIPAEFYSRADLILEGPAGLVRALTAVVDS